MKKSLQFLTGFLMISLLFMQGLRSQTTVVDIIVNSADHDTLEAAVIAAGLDDDLAGTGPFTVFAPTDSAFKVLPLNALDALLADPEGLLADLLLNHVVSGTLMAADLTDGQVLTTLLDEDVTVTINEDGVFINNAKVTIADIEADNGVVHVINAVIVPSFNTVMEIIAFSPAHDTLEFALAFAELDDDLAGEGPFTVFAPTDDAFKALPAGTIEALLPEIENILLYHVAPGNVMSGDLTDGQEIETLLGRNVNVTINEEGVFINNAKVVVADLVAGNGVVHVIDVVLIPQAETVVDIIVASAAHDTLEAAVIAAELADDLAGEGPFTVFAPTDDAFKALPEGVLDALLEDPTGDLADILLYHVVAGKVLSGDLTDGQVVTTLLGDNVTVTISEDGVFINDAEVILADLLADNGVVHVIDAVLIPEVAEAAFPIDFEVKTDAVWEVFANGANGLPTDFEVIDNPDKDGINTSDKVLKFVVNADGDPWAGAFSDSYAPVSFTQSSHTVTMMVWKSVISPVAFKVEASTNGGPVTEVKVPNTVTDAWELITFDMSACIGFSYDRIVIFPDFPDTRTAGTTAYIDNIEKLDEATGIINLNDSKKLGIYPNPAADRVQLSGLGEMKEGTLRIINTNGVEVLNRYVNDLSGSIDISRLDQGAYFLILESNGNRFTGKLLKK